LYAAVCKLDPGAIANIGGSVEFLYPVVGEELLYLVKGFSSFGIVLVVFEGTFGDPDMFKLHGIGFAQSTFTLFE
jgi:hypothetical protein